MDGHLPAAGSVLAVCAHPDDESFGLGAVLHQFASDGANVSVLCFTRGEASTLGADAGALRDLRADELERAASELGLHRVELLDYPDGDLASVPLTRLAEEVRRAADQAEADLLVVFDDGGVTGHPDHDRATAAALAGAPDLPALAWCVTAGVAETLNGTLGTHFAGRHEDQLDLAVAVNRTAQERAIACHVTQSGDNPVLRRRLALQGDAEALRWLRRPAATAPGTTPTPEDWDARYAERPRLFRAAPDETLVEFVDPLPPARALDVGAGEGRNALWLARQGWAVTALDVSAVALERLRGEAAAAHLDVTCVRHDAPEWLAEAARRGAHFELVVVSFVHPEPDARRTLLQAAAGVLAPRGHLFVVAHHRDSLGVVGPPDATRLYTEDDLRRAATGLEVLHLARRRGPNDTGTEGTDVVLWARRPA